MSTVTCPKPVLCCCHISSQLVKTLNVANGHAQLIVAKAVSKLGEVVHMAFAAQLLTFQEPAQ